MTVSFFSCVWKNSTLVLCKYPQIKGYEACLRYGTQCTNMQRWHDVSDALLWVVSLPPSWRSWTQCQCSADSNATGCQAVVNVSCLRENFVTLYRNLLEKLYSPLVRYFTIPNIKIYILVASKSRYVRQYHLGFVSKKDHFIRYHSIY